MQGKTIKVATLYYSNRHHTLLPEPTSRVFNQVFTSASLTRNSESKNFLGALGIFGMGKNHLTR